MTDAEREELTNEEADAFTKQTIVGEAMNIVREDLCIVEATAGLLEITEGMVKGHGEQTTAVVQVEGRLAGIIPMRLLLDELFVHIAPEEFLASLSEPEGVEEFGKISRASTAGELMQAPVCVNVRDTLKSAFVKMHKHGLDGLPVVDDEMHVVGYISLYELMRVWLRRRAHDA